MTRTGRFFVMGKFDHVLATIRTRIKLEERHSFRIHPEVYQRMEVSNQTIPATPQITSAGAALTASAQEATS